MTDLTLYNTLTRTKKRFEPIDPKNVRMYVCGPTVYDHAHIGNARPVIVFDVLFRLLRHIYGEEHVTYVRNITDVDDKITTRARRDFPDMPLNDAIAQVTEQTTAQFQADMAALGCLPPTHEPRATDHIDGMVAMIQTLIERGHAYVAKGEKGREVLFDVTSDDDYGLLSNRKLDDQQAGARVAVEGHKTNPGDFVLWKESAADEPSWEGEFAGETIHGRPGWHIECSAMAKEYLGDTFDIHGGGVDLIFPHHEDELAQSCCANQTERMCNFWLHNGFVRWNGEKMSKSAGNFFRVRDILYENAVDDRNWTGPVLRFATLSAPYREPVDFTVTRLEQAQRELEKLLPYIEHLQNSSFDNDHEALNYSVSGPSEDLIFLLSTDLNTQNVSGHFKRLMAQADGIFGGQWMGRAHHRDSDGFRVLGFDLREYRDLKRKAVGEEPTGIPASRINYLIEVRSAHQQDGEWPEADRIRDELLSQGIQLKDSKDPETGERITTWEVVR